MDRRKNNRLTRCIAAPGLWIQRITTKEPDDSMIECALSAVVFKILSSSINSVYLWISLKIINDTLVHNHLNSAFACLQTTIDSYNC